MLSAHVGRVLEDVEPCVGMVFCGDPSHCERVLKGYIKEPLDQWEVIYVADAGKEPLKQWEVVDLGADQLTEAQELRQ
jgi:hypothetical protein